MPRRLDPVCPVHNSDSVSTPRPAQVVASARDLPADGHLCWAYTDRAEFFERAGQFLTDAVAAGRPIKYVANRPVEVLRAELAEIVGHFPAEAAVFELDEFYCRDARGAIRPEATIKARVAVAQPHPGGLACAVVDATDMVRTVEQREAFARWEFLVDRHWDALAIGAMCAYDAQLLGPAAVSELACMHPFVSRGSSLFRIFTTPEATFALAGEVDRFARASFARTLERILPLCPDGPVVVDARGLEFIDHHGLHTLACRRPAARHDRRAANPGALGDGRPGAGAGAVRPDRRRGRLIGRDMENGIEGGTGSQLPREPVPPSISCRDERPGLVTTPVPPLTSRSGLAGPQAVPSSKSLPSTTSTVLVSFPRT